ncbi:MAG: hypothetical protein NVS2B9_18980 [Myxococcales bacterium]
MSLRNAMIASAVASLFTAAGAYAGDGHEGKTAGKTVKCGGVNACKGQGACAGADNACKAQNSCKGHGWTETSAKECKDQHGKIIAEAGQKDGNKKM